MFLTVVSFDRLIFARLRYRQLSWRTVGQRWQSERDPQQWRQYGAGQLRHDRCACRGEHHASHGAFWSAVRPVRRFIKAEETVSSAHTRLGGGKGRGWREWTRSRWGIGVGWLFWSESASPDPRHPYPISDQIIRFSKPYIKPERTPHFVWFSQHNTLLKP